MNATHFLIKVSRPRFWLYVLGPYLVGLVPGAALLEDLLRWDALIFGLYFLFPANLLIYGINDIFDFDTDRLNPKKSEYELLVRPNSHRTLFIWIAVLNIPFLAAAVYFAPQALLSLAGFIFFSIFYSAPPIRAKAIPILDSLFNVLYVFPALFAFQMVTGEFPPLVVLLAGGSWAAAMHAFSALPDIEADRKAGVRTLATLLGRNGTLLFCIAAYILSTILAFPYLGIVAISAGLIYFGIMLYALTTEKDASLFRIYRIFPLINSLIGFALFWYLAIPKAF